LKENQSILEEDDEYVDNDHGVKSVPLTKEETEAL
jgi:hypothetical protein